MTRRAPAIVVNRTFAVPGMRAAIGNLYLRRPSKNSNRRKRALGSQVPTALASNEIREKRKHVTTERTTRRAIAGSPQRRDAVDFGPAEDGGGCEPSEAKRSLRETPRSNPEPRRAATAGLRASQGGDGAEAVQGHDGPYRGGRRGDWGGR